MQTTEKLFDLVSNYQPAGDQVSAISQVSQWLDEGVRDMTIHGVTGSGKTFTMANIIAQANRPAIIYSPNKILAYQLYEELKAFFPNNAVHYYVSTFDLYRPEFVKNSEFHTKQSVTNEILEQMVLDATTALSSGRRDTIIVTSLSCVYGTGAPEMYRKSIIDLDLENPININELVVKLEHSGYRQTQHKLARGLYRLTESKAFICSNAYEETMRVWELRFDDMGLLERIDFRTRNIDTGEILDGQRGLKSGHIYPATRYAQDFYTPDEIKIMGEKMLKEAKGQRNVLRPDQYELLVQRLEDDINELLVNGYCNGIENYAWYFNRENMEREYTPDDYENMRPYTLMSYLAKDTVFFIDESHLALGQIQAASAADFSRKKDLISNGIRLPSCVINRPLKGHEVREYNFQTIYVSATPNQRELDLSGPEHVARLFIRPTYLLDPEIEVVYVDELEGVSYTQHVIQQINQTRANGGAVLLRCPDSKIARNYELLLQDLGYKAKVMLAETPAPERRELVERLQAADPNLAPLDVIIGVNLIREGLDIPRVEKVLIVYADVGGFLNDTTSLIQVIGRAARNTKGKVVIYMNNRNKMTKQIAEAIEQTQNRRQLQMDYNQRHNKTPRTAVANSYLNNIIARSYDEGFEDLFEDIEDLGFVSEEIASVDAEQQMVNARRVALNQASKKAAHEALAQVEAQEIEQGLRPQPEEHTPKKRGIPLPGSPEYEQMRKEAQEVGTDLSETKFNIFTARRRRK
ncbi:hypothetical protein CJP74_00655 [Psittacicella melopsittaci]|uniref:UvrABC system protein B n=1 Tax=Psittacicella melopsittaci TaxID=2028576 RepID=A0A3A1Y8M5_9GAMM|nr:DEAD/DEAH box helicase family protein [Psittacicella melopsittaci]RIY33901.1 hypothetical protein CJP74_00655 [Psittacicella melopsittaci]